MNTRKKTGRVVFMGWVQSVPPPSERCTPASDHDILRMVMLADDAQEVMWVAFRCESGEHAYKVRRQILGLGFEYAVVKRGEWIYVARI